MSDLMTFPDTWEEYEKSYGFTDNEEVYTNGARLIPSFRVKQWLDHLLSVQPRKGKWIDSGYGVECSLCGEWYPHASIARNQLNFCPKCGADMREGDAE